MSETVHNRVNDKSVNEKTALIQTKRNLYLNALRQAGKRTTAQRQAICQYLAETETHPTPYEVFEALSAQYPDMSRATVYNTLNVLQELGAIVEIGFGSGHTRYDTDTNPHINLICLRCHEISDYPGQISLDELPASVEEAGGFLPIATRVDVLGFCERCRELKKSEIREQWLALHGTQATQQGRAQHGSSQHRSNE